LIATPSACVLVAEAGDEVIGFATFHVFDLVYRSRPQARLTAIAVHPYHRRRGIGQALVRAVEDAARDRGCFRIEVTTRRDAQAAHAFYGALGYQERPVRFVKPLGG
jgi:ribosomal protein S18 acetylase RimI-like enzyme